MKNSADTISTILSKLGTPLQADKNIPEEKTSELVLEGVWTRTCEDLLKKLDKQIYTAWIKPLRVMQCDIVTQGNIPKSATVTLQCPNKFCSDHVQKSYGTLIAEQLKENLQVSSIEIVYTIASPSGSSKRNAHTQLPLLDPQQTKSTSSPKKLSGSSEPRRAPRTRKKNAQEGNDESNLNHHYNFSNYVVGDCNQFAHAACLKVSENPGMSYNPLFLYGGVGLGKTHLANAIGNAAKRRNKKVILVSSEQFVTQLISSLRSNTMERFKNKFRSIDILIIDDIQFIIGKERTQEEFFHTFNELYNNNKQIVITSDKTPQELIGLEERLRTRFSCGLSADVQAPDFETRVAILRKKAEANNMEVPDDVAGLLAERIHTNVRELEGALNKLQALCSLNEKQPSLSMAEEVVKRISPENKKDISTEYIQRVVAGEFHISVGDLLGKRRTQNIAVARQVAMYLCRKLTGSSYPEIGALFGGRDHSTVIHANKAINEKIKKNKEFADELLVIEGIISNS